MNLNITEENIIGHNKASFEDIQSVEGASLESVIIGCINDINYETADSFFRMLYDKMRLDGEVKIVGIDIVELSKRILRYKLTPSQYNPLLRKGLHIDLETITQICESVGFKTQKRGLEDIEFYIKVKK